MTRACPAFRQRADDEDERQTRVLHPEPEIPILEAAPAAVVHPVELEPQRSRPPASAGPRCPAPAAGRVPAPRPDTRPARTRMPERRPCSVHDEPAEQIAARKQPQRQERMRMHQRQSAPAHSASSAVCRMRFFARRRKSADTAPECPSPSRPAAPAAESVRVRDDVGKAQVEVRLIGGRSCNTR